MINNECELRGRYRLINYIDLPTGKREILSESDWIPNLITNSGRNNFHNRIAINGASPGVNGPIVAMAVGNPTTPVAPAQTDTALQSESVRKAVTYTVSGTPAWKTIFNASFSSAEINGCKEIGLFTSTVPGASTLCTRSLFGTTISIPIGSTMSIDYEIYQRTSIQGAGWVVGTGSSPTPWPTNVYAINLTPTVLYCVEGGSTGNGLAKGIGTSLSAGQWYQAENRLYVRCVGDTHPETGVGSPILITLA